jgi:hypothetical protein
MHYKIPKHIRTYVKRELYDYWDNLEKLKELQDELIDISKSNFEATITSSNISDPTFNNVNKLISNRTIAILQVNITRIDKMLEKLDTKGQAMFFEIFKNKKGCEEIDYISAGSYKHQKNKIIYLTAKEMKLL